MVAHTILLLSIQLTQIGSQVWSQRCVTPHISRYKNRNQVWSQRSGWAVAHCEVHPSRQFQYSEWQMNESDWLKDIYGGKVHTDNLLQYCWVRKKKRLNLLHQLINVELSSIEDPSKASSKLPWALKLFLPPVSFSFNWNQKQARWPARGIAEATGADRTLGSKWKWVTKQTPGKCLQNITRWLCSAQ